MALDKPIWVAGCMTGTSMDGVDVAMLCTDGVSIFEFGDTDFRPFTAQERALIAAAQGAWSGDAGVDRAADVIERAHLDVLKNFPSAELIGFHGQTLAHDPSGKGTHQCGDGAKLAKELGIPVVWDFRTADVKLGGQGAPLAPVYHHALVQWARVGAPVVVLNLGGVGNLTWVDPDQAADALQAFDTGPANAPLDDFVLQRAGHPFDRDGQLARAGQVQQDLVQRVLDVPFFSQVPPKSLDRNDFAGALDAVGTLSTEDGAATLTAIMVQSALRALDHLPGDPSQIWVSGGGAQNAFVMEQLQTFAPCPVERIDTFDIDPDMVEAQAFAYLAARVKAGLPTSFPGTTGVPASVGGGIISHPV